MLVGFARGRGDLGPGTRGVFATWGWVSGEAGERGIRVSQRAASRCCRVGCSVFRRAVSRFFGAPSGFGIQSALHLLIEHDATTNDDDNKHHATP